MVVLLYQFDLKLVEVSDYDGSYLDSFVGDSLDILSCAFILSFLRSIFTLTYTGVILHLI